MLTRLTKEGGIKPTTDALHVWRHDGDDVIQNRFNIMRSVLNFIRISAAALTRAERLLLTRYDVLAWHTNATLGFLTRVFFMVAIKSSHDLHLSGTKPCPTVPTSNAICLSVMYTSRLDTLSLST